MYFVSLVLDTRLNTLTFKFLTISGTHSFACGLLILLQLPLHLLFLRLMGKNVDSLLLMLTIWGLNLHSRLFIEKQLNRFTLVKVHKNTNPVKNYLLVKPCILSYYVIFSLDNCECLIYLQLQ